MIKKLNEKKALSRLMKFLSIEGVSGQEKSIAIAVRRDLIAAGVPQKYIFFDDVKNKIPVPTETGNLIVKLPGTIRGPRKLFMTHLDTVPLCSGAKPIQKKSRIESKNDTALGGDNRTGVACLSTMIICLLKNNIPHFPITVLYTVREEDGGWGARCVDPKTLGNPSMGFNVDGESPQNITIGAVGADRWEVEFFGKAAHAGDSPEKGASSSIAASIALREIYKKKWFGKILKNGKRGTSNVGMIAGRDGLSAGNATNVITDYVKVIGESRSHNPNFIRSITNAYRDEFTKASRLVKDNRGRSLRLSFKALREYHPFLLKKNSYVVKKALAVAKSFGWNTKLIITDGGLDANWTASHGIPTITFGAGQKNVHTVKEYVVIKQYLYACHYAVALATNNSK